MRANAEMFPFRGRQGTYLVAGLSAQVLYDRAFAPNASRDAVKPRGMPYEVAGRLNPTSKSLRCE